MTREEALEAALRGLLSNKGHAGNLCLATHPTTCLPACAAAQQALAMPKDVQGMRLIPHTSEDCDCCEVAHEERARLLRVAEAVAEVQAQRATDYVNRVLGTDYLEGFGAHMRTTLDLAAIVESVK